MEDCHAGRYGEGYGSGRREVADGRSEDARKPVLLPVLHHARRTLVFSCLLVDRLLKKGNYAQCVGAGTPVYLAEYLAAEILDLLVTLLEITKSSILCLGVFSWLLG
ncbi:hypothetical protein BDP27DRAFT_308791 [Rhodocollybia butyracea]|uniref:Histone H2A n=1 Tax=Rhodocollybia butyracea TaxID=206335 RepID=A0A9P5PH33_9AGAR|nr:hypothetical protein BDP27DRAFT_308791 [Rhodocollybia butyracea]